MRNLCVTLFIGTSPFIGLNTVMESERIRLSLMHRILVYGKWRMINIAVNKTPDFDFDYVVQSVYEYKSFKTSLIMSLPLLNRWYIKRAIYNGSIFARYLKVDPNKPAREIIQGWHVRNTSQRADGTLLTGGNYVLLAKTTPWWKLQNR
jgi:hypothetical protein